MVSNATVGPDHGTREAFATPVDLGSVCERCGMGDHDHHTHHCKNPTKCVNCGGEHLSRSNECQTWKNEKEMRLKVTKSLNSIFRKW